MLAVVVIRIDGVEGKIELGNSARKSRIFLTEFFNILKCFLSGFEKTHRGA